MMEIWLRGKENPARSRAVRNFARKFVRTRRGGNVVSKGGDGTVVYFVGSAVLHVPKTPTTTSPSGALTSGVTHPKSWSQRQARLAAACSSWQVMWEAGLESARVEGQKCWGTDQQLLRVRY
jgi:hypothetical protein